MPDWKRIVSENMSALNLPSGAREEVITELAVHMEETYEHAHSRGLTETAALEATLQEINDWYVLAANITRAKSEDHLMNNRTRSLWLPGLASFAAASLFLLVLTQVSLQPRYLAQLNSGLGRSFYIGWLIAQVLFGALGAFLSRRAGGTRGARVIAATFPAIVMFGLWAIWIPVSAFVEHNAFVVQHPLYYARGFFPWVVLPGMALLLGAAPFLKESTPLKA